MTKVPLSWVCGEVWSCSLSPPPPNTLPLHSPPNAHPRPPAAVTFKAEIHKELAAAPDVTWGESEYLYQAVAAMALDVEQISAWAAPDGHILWTLTNHGWLDFTLNWVATVSRAGVEHFFVATLDDK